MQPLLLKSPSPKQKTYAHSELYILYSLQSCIFHLLWHKEALFRHAIEDADEWTLPKWTPRCPQCTEWKTWTCIVCVSVPSWHQLHERLMDHHRPRVMICTNSETLASSWLSSAADQISSSTACFVPQFSSATFSVSNHRQQELRNRILWDKRGYFNSLM